MRLQGATALTTGPMDLATNATSHFRNADNKEGRDNHHANQYHQQHIRRFQLSDRASQIAALQKQLRTLTQQVKDLASNTSLDAKTKQQESQLLQAQIAAVEAEIAAIQSQQQLAQITKANAAASKQVGKTQASPKTAAIVTADQVDVYA